jgi:hypothetical protein
LLAVPLRVFGMSAGPLLTAAAINLSCALIALWVFFRRLGLTAMLWAGVLLLAVIWSAGTAVLTDTLSSNMTMYPLLATAALTWALVDGDLALLVLGAFVASYAAQQHLAAGLVVLPLALLALGAIALQVVRRARAGDRAITKRALRWAAAAIAVAGVCWLPVAYDAVNSNPGNLGLIVRLARDNTRPTLGLTSGFEQALHGVAPPTVLTRTDTTGLFFVGRVHAFTLVLGVVALAALIALGWAARSRARAVARLVLVVLVLLAAGIINGSKVPDSVESSRVNLYRWAWTGALLTWVAIGIGVVLVAGRVLGSRPIVARMVRGAPVALLVVTALIAASIVFVSGSDDHNRERPAFALEKLVATKTLARVDRRHPVVVIADGYAANIAVMPHILFRLIRAGVTVEVPDHLTATYGKERRYRPGPDVSAVYIASGDEHFPSSPGELIAVRPFSPERDALIGALAAAARGVKVELAPGSAAFIKRHYTGVRGEIVKRLLAMLPTDPRPVFETPEFVQLLLDGLLRAPVLDRAKMQRLLELPSVGNTINGEERIEVRIVSPAELRATHIPGL